MCTKSAVQQTSQCAVNNLRNPLFKVKRLLAMNDMHNSDTDSTIDLLILYDIIFFSSQNLNLESVWKLYITTTLHYCIFSCWAEQSIDCTQRSLAVTRNPASLVYILFMGLLTTKLLIKRTLSRDFDYRFFYEFVFHCS
jgi:hypothetical protein